MITVIKSNFFVKSDKVSDMVDALVETFPQVEPYLVQKHPAQQFQYAMFLLGWHTRITHDGTVFSLGELPIAKLPITIDNTKLLKVIGQFSNPKSFIEFIEDGKPTKLILNDSEPNGESILAYVIKQEAKMKETGAEPIEEIITSKPTTHEIIADMNKRVDDEEDEGPFIEVELNTEDPEKTTNDMLTKAVEKIEEKPAAKKRAGRPKRQPFEKKTK